MKKILLFPLLFFAVACGKEEAKEDILMISLPYGKENISDFEESDFDYSFEIIPMELDTSNVNSYITGTYRIVHYKGRYYFPSNREAIQIFDKDGHFVNTICAGKGAGEVMNTIDLLIDKEQDQLEISMLDKVSKYTLDGDYLSSESIKLCMGDAYKSGDFYYMYSDYLAHVDSCFLNIFNYKTNKLVFDILPKPQKDYGTGFLTYNRFVEYNDAVYFTMPYHNEVYKIEKGDSVAHKYAEVKNSVNYTKCPDLYCWKVEEYAKTNSEYVMLECWSHSDNYIAFTANIGSEVVDDYAYSIEQRVLYDREKKRVYKYPVTSIHIAYTDQYYDYATVDPAELDAKRGSFTATEKPLMDKLCESIDRNGIDTNPYVVKIKIFKK